MLRFIFLLLLLPYINLKAQVYTLYDEVLAITSKVENERKFPQEWGNDSVMTLPFGVGKTIAGSTYFIAIDSAVFTPQQATCNAYMAISLPGALKKIAFASKGISFNPKGFKPFANGKMFLASDVRIPIGPSVHLLLKNDGNNYVEWDCEGFKGINISGEIEFSSSLLIPISGNSVNDKVKAQFQVYASNPKDILCAVTMEPFTIKGIDDFSFEVTQAVFDFSSTRNFPSVNYPSYGSEGLQYGIDFSWTGVYIKQFKLSLPKGFSSNSNQPFSINCKNLFIDDQGINGKVEFDNPTSVFTGNVSGWRIEINRVSIELNSSRLVSGSMQGKIYLPLDNSTALMYSASISQHPLNTALDYCFSLNANSEISLDAFHAKLELSSASLRLERKSGTLFPFAKLNGKIKFATENTKIPYLGFQDLALSTQAPYLSGGIFSLSSESGTNGVAEIAGFTASLREIKLIVNSQVLYFIISAGIHLTHSTDLAFGLDVTAKIKSRPINGPIQGSTYAASTAAFPYQYHETTIDDASLRIQSPVFSLEGSIQFKSSDPVYGKGFGGNITAKVVPIQSPFSASVFFGKKNSYPFFFVDASNSAIVVLIPPSSGIGVACYKFLGGFTYHMKPSNQNLCNSLHNSSFYSHRNYEPDSSMSCSFKVGTTIGSYPVPLAFNGDCVLETFFNSNGGLDVIRLQGNCFFGVTIGDRVGKPTSTMPLTASVNFQYDFISKITDAVFLAAFHSNSANGQGQGILHVAPDNWQLCLGRPSNKANVNLNGIGNIQMYLMMGTELEAVPQPPPQVAAICETANFNLQRNLLQLTSGNAFVLGAQIEGGFNNTYGFDFFQVYCNANYLAGFDLMTVKLPSTVSCASNSSPGWNRMRVNGNIYAFVSGAAGIRGHIKWPIGCESSCVLNEDFDITIFNLNLACILQAKLPNPNYIKGSLRVHYNILGKIQGDLDLKLEAGTDCASNH